MLANILNLTLNDQQILNGLQMKYYPECKQIV